VSWQIVPTVLDELLHDKDQARAQRVGAALMQMDKIDIARLQQAANQR
jgi:predicted 3-demethylubiquinone-9 3-methyltransferase (glyoxalase superfamily)